MQVFWSVRGGAGVSVVAAISAIHAIRDDRDALLVDLDGGLPSILGIAHPEGPGIGEWSQAPSDLPVDALSHLEVPLLPGLSFLTRGAGPVAPDRVGLLAALLGSDPRTVIVDAGQLAAAPERADLARVAGASILVTAACPAALEHLAGSTSAPSGVVVVHRHVCHGGTAAVARAASAPILAELEHDPALARAVDLGLLGRRLPRRVVRAAESLT